MRQQYSKSEIASLKRIAKLVPSLRIGAIKEFALKTERTVQAITTALYGHDKMKRIKNYHGRNHSKTTNIGEIRFPIESISINNGMLVIKFIKTK